MKVAKFGGSSVASAEQIKKVSSIIKNDPDRKFIVVSAPGKRFPDDIKVTDILIDIAAKHREKKPYEDLIHMLLERFKSIIIDLQLSSALIEELDLALRQWLSDGHTFEASADGIKSLGEDFSAKIVSAYLNSLGIEATYLNPKDAGIVVSDEPGNAQILPESFQHLYALRECEGIFIIPGFFGYTPTGKLATFPRGGSDITGSIVAAGVKAGLYENFTDVDSVCTVNPAIVKNPKKITTLTYREMRELSYAGFSVFHDEALIPAFREGIPVCIKNTNNPKAPGTMIVSEKKLDGECVVGIASDTAFCSLYVSKYLMNRELGFGRKLLNILEDEHISFEHAPSGIDDLSVILRQDQLTIEKERKIMNRINDELHADQIKIHRDLAVIMIVGEGMMSTIGIAQKATNAFKDANVNIEMINQGSSEVSMMFGIHSEDLNRAIQSLYKSFFE